MALRRINLVDLLESPRNGMASADKGQVVQVVSDKGRSLFEATVVAPGMIFSDEAVKAGVEAYEVRSPCQMTWVRNMSTGDDYNVFARRGAEKNAPVRFVYDLEAEFRALVTITGGQPQVSVLMNNIHFLFFMFLTLYYLLLALFANTS
jgi:hypothetical protein